MSKEKGLGKGLDAIFGNDVSTELVKKDKQPLKKLRKRRGKSSGAE